MDWVPIEDAKTMPGLRVVLARGAWGAWSECVKNLLHIKQLPYARVAQMIFEENAELVAWTGVRNQPQVVFDDDPVRTGWLDILNLLERLGPEPALLPEDSESRALVIGLSNEICGERGLVWCRRIELNAKADLKGLRGRIMKTAYGVTGGDIRREEERMAGIIASIAAHLNMQKSLGRRYIVGDRLTALDVYWATMSNLFGPLPEDLCPIPQSLKERFSASGPTTTAALDPILFEHRDYIYETYLPLPIDFG